MTEESGTSGGDERTTAGSLKSSASGEAESGEGGSRPPSDEERAGPAGASPEWLRFYAAVKDKVRSMRTE
ncbi:hypothetical protein IJ21_38450 [Paenibacillus sp. 32O-W]|uniref:hypothetical protein n=1 Tax=Paenibacillus sp. 32O-W TaxID=1695218 RepID=UPI0007217406|nr:hypothetical protein [Paenibacillus sp. 32O-W]ALS29231.1 hypothetical protein IJ21_38450 [Paenibacillus sp. 32O-W]